jgi:hypothetical protein
MKIYIAPSNPNLFMTNGKEIRKSRKPISISLAKTKEHASWIASSTGQTGFFSIEFVDDLKNANGFLYAMSEHEAKTLFRHRKIRSYIQLKRRRKFGRYFTVLSPSEAKGLGVLGCCRPVFYQYVTTI